MFPLLLLTLATYCIVPDQSAFRVQADTAGIFGMFAHDHLIETKQIQGCASIDLERLAGSSVELTFAAAGLKVMDPSASAADRAKVQAAMEEQVLRPKEYPEIRFRSQAVENDSGTNVHRFSLRGPLTLLDSTRTIVVPMTLETLPSGDLRVRGQYTLRQTEFGIKPIRIAGGTIRVKDEIRLEFDLLLKR